MSLNWFVVSANVILNFILLANVDHFMDRAEFWASWVLRSLWYFCFGLMLLPAGRGDVVSKVMRVRQKK